MPIVRITLPAEKRALREKMRALGLGHREIAAEFARRYRLPPAAWREAHGWSRREAAAQINAYTGTVGLDPGGISSMTAPHLCEHESWPGPARSRPAAAPRPTCWPCSPALRLHHQRPDRPGRPRATPSRRPAHPRHLQPGNSQSPQRKPSAPTTPPTSTACAETTPVRAASHHLTWKARARFHTPCRDRARGPDGGPRRQ
jgi:hypothetical protein